MKTLGNIQVQGSRRPKSRNCKSLPWSFTPESAGWVMDLVRRPRLAWKCSPQKVNCNHTAVRWSRFSIILKLSIGKLYIQESNKHFAKQRSPELPQVSTHQLCICEFAESKPTAPQLTKFALLTCSLSQIPCSNRTKRCLSQDSTWTHLVKDSVEGTLPWCGTPQGR